MLFFEKYDILTKNVMFIYQSQNETKIFSYIFSKSNCIFQENNTKKQQFGQIKNRFANGICDLKNQKDTQLHP